MSKHGYITLPIIIVLMSISYLYYVIVFVVIEEWLGLATASGVANAALFTAVVVMAMTLYFVAVFRDPGAVPADFSPDVEDHENPIHEIKRKGGELRYCQKCSHYKPPRAHHCRVCKRCVLRMDHHCVWINNCVGHTNYKVFFVFLLYAVIACIYSLVLLLGSTADDVHKDHGSFKITYIISGLLLVPLTMALGILFGWHIYLTSQNKTTIEYHEGVRAVRLAEKVGNIYRNPYDLGVYNNFTSVLGPNVFCWVCPTTKHIGSGIRFRTSYDQTPVHQADKSIN